MEEKVTNFLPTGNVTSDLRIENLATTRCESFPFPFKGVEERKLVHLREAST